MYGGGYQTGYGSMQGGGDFGNQATGMFQQQQQPQQQQQQQQQEPAYQAQSNIGMMGQGSGMMGGAMMGGGAAGAGAADSKPVVRAERHDTTFKEGKIFLGGLDNNSTKDSLIMYCQQWGEICDAVVMEGRGFGFATFTDGANAATFLETREHTIDGKRVEAKAAVPKPKDQAYQSRYGAGGAMGGGMNQTAGAPTNKMFVGGTGDINDEEFREYFGQFGEIKDAVIVRLDGISRGFGFVTYSDTAPVDKCLQMGSHQIGGKRVEVKRAVPKEGGADGQRGGGGGGAYAMGGRGGGMNNGGMRGGMGGGYGGGRGYGQGMSAVGYGMGGGGGDEYGMNGGGGGGYNNMGGGGGMGGGGMGGGYNMGGGNGYGGMYGGGMGNGMGMGGQAAYGGGMGGQYGGGGGGYGAQAGMGGGMGGGYGRAQPGRGQAGGNGYQQNNNGAAGMQQQQRYRPY